MKEKIAYLELGRHVSNPSLQMSHFSGHGPL